MTFTENGEKYETKIGPDGKGIKERHHKTHNREHTGHTDPHDHEIIWDERTGAPRLNPDATMYPNGAPAFKKYQGVKNMVTIVEDNSFEQDRFKTISECKLCLKNGGEIEFEWKGKLFDIVHDPDGMVIYEANKGVTERKYQTADDLLEYIVSGDRLRDVITQVKVWARTI